MVQVFCKLSHRIARNFAKETSCGRATLYAEFAHACAQRTGI
jgi:hypothetical protein